MNPPPEPSLNFLQLLDLLRTATNKGVLRWEKTADSDDFRAPVVNGYIWLTRFPQAPPGVYSGDSAPGLFTISFINGEGQMLERVYSISKDEIVFASQFHFRVKRLVSPIWEQEYQSMFKDLKENAK